jgi:hypothetical protein
MDMFKEYGITKEELLSTISDAINFIDRTDDESGLSDRLFEVLEVVKELSKDYRK